MIIFGSKGISGSIFFGKAEEHLALFEVTKCGNVTYEPVFSILLTVLLGFCFCFEAAQA